jgi:hypothetical protein
MTVALSDCVYIRNLLQEIPDFANYELVDYVLQRFYKQREGRATTINILAFALYLVFCCGSDGISLQFVLSETNSFILFDCCNLICFCFTHIKIQKSLQRFKMLVMDTFCWGVWLLKAQWDFFQGTSIHKEINEKMTLEIVSQFDEH